MTEVEFSRALSELSATAKVLNEKSASINDLIARFEATLRDINVGLEVWLEHDPVLSVVGESDAHGKVSENTEIGFAKIKQEWCLAGRFVTYGNDDDGEWGIVVTQTEPQPLRSFGRTARIAALPLFPALVDRLKAVADAAVKAIGDAQRFVK